MNHKPENGKDLLIKVDKLLENEGMSTTNKNDLKYLMETLIPALENSKNTLNELYKFQPPKKGGILGKFKGFFVMKLRNIVFNIIEKQSMGQQRFNEQTLLALKVLAEENKGLRDRVK